MHQTSSKVLSLELLRSLLRTTGNKNLNFGQSLIHRAITKLRFKPNSMYLSHSSTPCWILHVSRFFGPHLSYFLRGSARTILVLSRGGTLIFRVSSQLRLPTPTLLPSQMSCYLGFVWSQVHTCKIYFAENGRFVYFFTCTSLKRVVAFLVQCAATVFWEIWEKCRNHLGTQLSAPVIPRHTTFWQTSRKHEIYRQPLA